jgi:hypothetical protein
MKITNKHARTIDKPIKEVADLLSSLSSNNDQLWPHERWAPMKLDRELAEEATGGHGPIQYVVTEYKPGKKIKFKFLEPANFQGNHWFEIEEKEDKRTEITHTIDMNVSGAAILSWIFIIRPMHDALIEDSFDKAALNLGLNIQPKKWSPWVRLLKRIFNKKPA